MRKLGEQDKERVFSYLKDEPEFNLFLLGDWEVFGADSPDVTFFAEEKDTAIDSVVLRYMKSYIVYSRREDFQVLPVVRLLGGQTFDNLCGKGAIVQRLAPYCQSTLRKTYLARLDEIRQEAPLPDGFVLRRLIPEDAEKIVGLYLQIDQFKEQYQMASLEESVYQVRSNLENGGRYVGAYQGECLVSLAGSSAENSMSAMVIGVATLPSARGKGCASALIAALCGCLLREGKQFVCLFYDNPEAGRIYHRIGFREMGTWAMFGRGALRLPQP